MFSLLNRSPAFCLDKFCDVNVEANVTVSRDGDAFSVNIEYAEVRSYLSSASSFLSSKNLRFTHSEMERLPHDLVLSLFSVERPRTIGETELKRHDNFDRLTPDIVSENFIFELGTNVLGARLAFDSKIDKYAVLARTRGVPYLVLGVSSNGVVSNFELRDAEVVEIVSCYVVGRKIQSKAAKVGYIDVKSPTDMDHYMKFSAKGLEDLTVPEVLTTMEKETWETWSHHNKIEMSYDGVEFYRELRTKCTKDVINKIREHLETDIDVQDQELIGSYVKEVESLPTKEKTDKKRLAIPLAMVKQGDFNFNGILKYEDEMGDLWSSLWCNRIDEPHNEGYDSLRNIIKTPKEEMAERTSKEHQLEMRKKDRWSFVVSHDVEVALARKGLNKKQIIGKEIREEKRLTNVQKSLGYSLTKDYDLSDINDFISDESLLTHYKQNDTWNQIWPLLSAGGFDIGEDSVKFFKDYFDTKLGHCMSFLHALYSEINLNIRKPTKRNEFLVKKVAGYACLVAIHNTGSDKHSFYTVIVHKNDFETEESLRVFRPWSVAGDYFVSDLCSTRKHDVSNLLFCHNKVLSIVATHCEVFSNELTFEKKFDCTKEMLFHTLVYLENSNQTSETLQQLRFFYMKTNSCKLLPEPIFSPLEKMPTIIRSRLCLFAIKRVISEFKMMSKNRSEIEHIRVEERNATDNEESFSEDLTKGLTSYISGRQLKNYEEALLLSYGGIYHNKEKSDAVNSNLQIYRKLTKEELKLDPSLKHNYINGFDDVPADEMPPHGFSATHVRNCGVVFKEELKAKGIEITDFYQKAAIDLNKITYEELATFKASLDSEHLTGELTSGKYPDLKFGREAYDDKGKFKFGKTKRALEGVLDVLENLNLDENVKPFQVVSSLIKECNKKGGIVTVLFKKAQFGSVREIFILTMFSRIVVRFVESLARSACELLPNEYLTKGKDKLNSTPTHYEKVRNLKGTNDITLNVFDSLDCKTWCQNFTFPVFGNLFSVIFSDWPDASEVIRTVFNMASAKRHEMTETLMKLFEKNQKVNSTEESMNVLKREFLGDGGTLNVGEKSIFVNNVSNFMQGIFHYTSSVMHSTHLLLMSRIMVTFMKSGRLGVKNVIHTTKASSDDSSSLLTVTVSPTSSENMSKIRAKLLICSEMLSRSYPLMCAKIGIPKSTRFVESGIEEFNSSWSYRNTVLSVPSKFTTAAVCPKITKSTIERQRVDHSSINTCIESGCSYKLCRIIEVACAVNHYEVIGFSSLSREVWRRLSSDIIELSNPSTYLYIASPKIIGTTLGFDSTLFNFLSEKNISRKVQHVVEKMLAGTFDLKNGLLVQSSIMVGSKKKYNSFLERIGSDKKYPSACEAVSRSPIMLYRESFNSKEVYSKIMLKAKSSGAERAFIFEDESAMHSTSAYLSTAASLTVSMRKEGEWVRQKMSLPAYLDTVKGMISSSEYIPPIEPHSEMIMDMVKSYDEKKKIFINRRRKLPVKIRFPKTRGAGDLSLMSVVRMLWFGISNNRSVEENLSSFNSYKNSCHWLRDTHDETIAFIKSTGVEDNSYFVLNMLIINEVDKDRTVGFLHTGRRDSTMVNTYLKCLEYNYERDYRLVRPEELFSPTEMGQFVKIEEQMYPHLMIDRSVRKVMENKKENDMEDPASACVRIIHENKDLFLKDRSEQDIRFLPSRLKNLLAIGSVLLSPSQDEKKKHILTNGPGFIITFFKKQERVMHDGSVSWKGKGEMFIETLAASFLIEVEDDKLTKIKTNSPNRIVRSIKILNNAFKTLKIKRDTNKKINGEGLRFIGGSWQYTGDRGTKVEVMSFSDDMKRSTITNKIIVKPRCLIMEVKTETERKGRHDSEPIRFTPESLNVENLKHQLTIENAATLIVLASKKKEENSMRTFVTESFLDRSARLGFTKNKKYEKIRCSTTEMASSALTIEEGEMDMAMFLSDDENDAQMIADVAGVCFDEEIDATIIGPVNTALSVEDKMDDLGDLDIGNVIEEFSFVNVVSTNSYTTSYEELPLWDNFLNNCEKILSYSYKSMLERNYHLPEKGTEQREVLDAMIELKLIKSPEKVGSFLNFSRFSRALEDDDDEIPDQ